MILQKEVFKTCSTKAIIELKCDYCNKEFTKTKRSIILCNKNVNKDSCTNKDCRKKKRLEINEFLKNCKSHQEKLEINRNNIKKNNIEKYGCENYLSSNEFKEKRKKTLIEKYGTTSLLLNKDILEKHKSTCLERYGVDNYSKSDGFYDKVVETNIKKYGVKSAMSSKDVLNKRETTSLKKYGKKNYTQTPEYLENRKKTCLEKYGVEHSSQFAGNRDKAKITCLERYGVDNYSKTDESKERYIKTCLKKYGVPNPLLIQSNQIYGKTQNELKNWLNSFGFKFNSNYSILQGKEIDLYDNNLNIAIEYCGLFWHNELSPSPRLKSYHYDKHMKCQEKEIQLITIFEDEWKNRQIQCKNRLKSILKIEQNPIYARKCKIMECSKKQFNEFCDLYHLQGSNNLGIIFYGLFYQNDLIACMSFGKHHRNKNILTLDRLCFKAEQNIIGGSSKLFAACVKAAKNQGYKEVISWSDNRWSQGNIYQKLGFNLVDKLSPDYSYVNIKNPGQRLSKQSQKKSNTGCPKDKTEHEWAMENGLGRIWDCGKIRWKYTFEKT